MNWVTSSQEPSWCTRDSHKVKGFEPLDFRIDNIGHHAASLYDIKIKCELPNKRNLTMTRHNTLHPRMVARIDIDKRVLIAMLFRYMRIENDDSLFFLRQTRIGTNHKRARDTRTENRQPCCGSSGQALVLHESSSRVGPTWAQYSKAWAFRCLFPAQWAQLEAQSKPPRLPKSSPARLPSQRLGRFI